MASVLGHYSFERVVSASAYRALASPDLSPLMLVTGQNRPSLSPQHTFLFCSSLDTRTFSSYDRSQPQAIETSGGVDDQNNTGHNQHSYPWRPQQQTHKQDHAGPQHHKPSLTKKQGFHQGGLSFQR